jgi:uncharacterized membrane protein YgcG
MKKFLLATSLILFGILGYSQERILSFDSKIEIQKNGALHVTETIRVRAEGDQIRRGIYRAFPTRYTTSRGHKYRVKFDVQEVLRDGQPDAFHIQSRSNGVDVYIGREDYFLPIGEYTYTIRYITDRQMGFFDDYDELYWNVTGNDWGFRIERVTYRIVLAEPAELVQSAAYTGYQGEAGQDFRMFMDGPEVVFETTRALQPKEGLTVAVAWPKGIVEPPSEGELREMFMRDNLPLMIGYGALGLLFLYYLFAWIKVGKDPEKGPIMPLFEPPTGLSPGDLRVILKMKYDIKSLVADLVELGVKGFVRIDQDKKKFSITKLKEVDDDTLYGPEKDLMSHAFGRSSTLEFKEANQSKIASLMSYHRLAALKEIKGKMYKLNGGWVVPAILLTVISMLAMIILLATDNEMYIAFIPLSMFIIIPLFAVFSILKSFFSYHKSIVDYMKLVFGLVFTFIFLGIGLVAGYFIMDEGNMSYDPLIILMGHVTLHVLFIDWIKAPTKQGRLVMDEIEGFQMFLLKAEQERFNKMQDPKAALALFERYLPYAIALDAVNQWAKAFETRLAALGQKPETHRSTWYHTTAGIHSFESMGTTLSNSLSSSISSSGTPPSSSSGSGGGGSSGGGGGGGGGGGW